MFGKVLGAIVGIIVGLIVGSPELGLGMVALGLVLGHLFLDRETRALDAANPQTARRAGGSPPAKSSSAGPTKLAKALAPIFVEVARADGEVSREEIRVVRECFEHDLGVRGDNLGVVSLALKEAIAAPPGDLEKLVVKGRKAVKPAQRLKVVNALYAMALVDGEMNKSERDALKRVVNNFNLSEEQLKEITRVHLGAGTKHYTALGLTEAASDEDIRAAFRRLAAENHPDKAAHLGKDEAASAAERFREVKDAYEELKKLRGL